MTDFMKIPSEEYERLHERVKYLSKEKSQLQLLYELIKEIPAATGLDNTIKSILRLIMNTIGGLNVTLCYSVDEEWFAVDIYDNKHRLTEINDPLISKALDSRSFIEDTEGSILMNESQPPGGFSTGTTWVFPMTCRDSIIGALKLEGIRLGFDSSIKDQFQVFVNYVSLILQNEIINFSRLNDVNNNLKKINNELLHEIAERKKTEEERKRLTIDLEKKNRELEQVLYISSHDLRSPLVNVDGYNKEINRHLKELFSILEKETISTEAKKKILFIIKERIPEAENYISQSVIKMDALLKGLLRVSRIGSVEIRKTDLDMNKIVSDVRDALAFEIKQRGVSLEISDLPSCTGDHSQINQVFSNLIENALKYLAPGRIGIIRVSGTKEDRRSLYCVEDNGIGILPGHLDKIFEIFYQLEPRKSGGEGLGLTIVHKILEKHDGKIWVESEAGEGSKFYVSLPST